MTLVQKSKTIATIAWRAMRWPFLYRRLPNRNDLARFARHVKLLLRSRRPPADRYSVWLENNRWTARTAAAAERELAAMPRRPLLSVVMPVFNVEARWLEAAVESVRRQVYPRWELCIADDASTSPHVAPLLRRFAGEDGRIRVRFLGENGNISRATNAAAEMARGEFLVFLDHDDELTPDCLLELAKVGATTRDCDIIYSDDDKIDVEGRRFAPQFKSDWSPELLLSYMYFVHVFAVRRELFERIGGCRTGFEGCQDYDLALRAVETARRIVHIPRILYHWRCLPASTASSGAAKPEAFGRGVQAVQDALDRRGAIGKVSRPDFAVRNHLGIFQLDFPDEGPRVAILIPTRNRVNLLRPCIESVLDRTRYSNYEIVVIDDGSDDPDTLEYLRKLREPCRVLHLTSPAGKFNYAWLNNEAARHVRADYLLLLNNDTEALRPEWLSQMVGYAGFPGVGAVGARLLFPNGRIQHAGVVLGIHDRLPSPSFKDSPGADNGYLSQAVVARNCSAVTAACMLIRRDTFLEAGGFDEQRFAVAFNDVDLCLRLGQRGLRCVYAPRAELIHHEGATRGIGADNPRELIEFRRTWGSEPDPYLNPNLSRDSEQFEIRTRRTIRSREQPIRALLCSHNLNLEGAPLIVFELARGLRERGHVLAEVYSHVGGPLEDRYRRAGIPVHVTPYPPHDADLGEDFAARIAGFGVCAREHGYDVIIGNTLDSFWAIHAARAAGVPSLWSVHESVDWREHFRQYGGLAAAAAQAFSMPYRVVFAAKSTRLLFEELNCRHHFDVIPSVLRPDSLVPYRDPDVRGAARREIGADSGRTVFAIVGTTCPRKGQLDFTRAAMQLLEGGRRDLLFLIVGCRPGEYLDRIQKCVAGRRDAFHFAAETDGALRLLAASDVFVCCSENESYPRVILEALALSKPIVTTLVYGIAEQVSANFSALTYLPGDVASLAKHMARLADDPAERQRLSDGARQQWDGLLNYADMVERYEQLFLEAAMTNPIPARMPDAERMAA